MDDKEVSGLGLKGFSSDEKPPLAFDFRGGATIKKERKFKQTIDLELLPELNSKSSIISDEIKSDIKAKLPAGVEVTVDIEFSRGSIDWVGIIAIAGWTALIADNISFVEYVTKAVKFSINKIVRSQIAGRVPVQNIYTNVEKKKKKTRFILSLSFYGGVRAQ